MRFPSMKTKSKDLVVTALMTLALPNGSARFLRVLRE
jgi:hypothetical protein